MKTDKQIQQDVLDVLTWDAAVNAADVGVTDLVDRLVVSYRASMPLQDATAANAAPRSADRGADRGDGGSHKALRAVVIGTNIVLLAAAAIAGAILMIVFSLAWMVIFLWMATLSVIGFAGSLSAGRR